MDLAVMFTKATYVRQTPWNPSAPRDEREEPNRKSGLGSSSPPDNALKRQQRLARRPSNCEVLVWEPIT